MKERGPCPGCGQPFRPTIEAYVLRAAGVLERSLVCADCGSRAVRVVVPDVRVSAREILLPFARHIKRIAKAYDMNDDGRALGLVQAAELLEVGRVPVDEVLEDAPRPPKKVVIAPATLNGHAPARRKAPAAAVDELTSYHRALLWTLRRYGGRLPRPQLGFLSGYSPRSGGFSKALGLLRAQGLLEGFALTEAGVAAASPVDGLPQGPELITYWCERVGDYAGALLQVLATAYPGELPREVLAERSGYASASGGFSKALGKLRKLDLVPSRGPLRASEAFMGAVSLSTKGSS